MLTCRQHTPVGRANRCDKQLYLLYQFRCIFPQRISICSLWLASRLTFPLATNSLRVSPHLTLLTQILTNTSSFPIYVCLPRIIYEPAYTIPFSLRPSPPPIPPSHALLPNRGIIKSKKTSHCSKSINTYLSRKNHCKKGI
jgi:hypothetical protein